MMLWTAATGIKRLVGTRPFASETKMEGSMSVAANKRERDDDDQAFQ
jgi:hypothetical protein